MGKSGNGRGRWRSSVASFSSRYRIPTVEFSCLFGQCDQRIHMEMSKSSIPMIHIVQSPSAPRQPNTTIGGLQNNSVQCSQNYMRNPTLLCATIENTLPSSHPQGHSSPTLSRVHYLLLAPSHLLLAPTLSSSLKHLKPLCNHAKNR